MQTDYHLTNYKPDFMLLAADAFPQARNLFYFDPDIVLTTGWKFFQEWLTSGVALCEDINSPIPKNHPVRTAWRRYFGELGFDLSYKESVYVNGGFLGLKRERIDFVNLWKSLQEAMAPAIGGLHRSSIGAEETPRPLAENPINPFWKTDQDALNACVEAYSDECSIIGKEAMGFQPGLSVMAHSQGQFKPWSKSYLLATLQGFPPSFAEKEYWKHANRPIQIASQFELKAIRLKIALCCFIGRFSRKL